MPQSDVLVALGRGEREQSQIRHLVAAITKKEYGKCKRFRCAPLQVTLAQTSQARAHPSGITRPKGQTKRHGSAVPKARGNPGDS